MVTKPSFLVGITKDGKPEVLKVSLEPEEIKQAYFKEVNDPSSKYVQVQMYRKPPYWRRRDISRSTLPSSLKKEAQPEAKAKAKAKS